jgi:hypothetical protein
MGVFFRGGFVEVVWYIRAVIKALFILGRVCFQKYQFEIYLLESVLQSFLTDGPGHYFHHRGSASSGQDGVHEVAASLLIKVDLATNGIVHSVYTE